MPDKEEERRHEFMDAAEKLFKENGIVDTTISSIVRELDVAKGLFYYYFKSKDDVIDAISEKYNGVFNEMMKASMDSPSFEDRLDQYVNNCIASFRKLGEQLKGRDNEVDLSPLVSRSMEEARTAAEQGLEKLIEEGNEKEVLKLEYPHHYAKIIVGGIITLVEEEPQDEVIQKIIMDLLDRSGKEEENV
ncbi:MAG: TetR/AcrR family transcriptional regulator [Bulleidia sp.]